MQKAQGPGVCKLPKPPATRALCQAKRAPRAAFPSGFLAAQTKCWAEGIRVPAPLAGGGSSTAGEILRVCPEIACQTGLLGALLQSRDLSMWCEAFPCAFSPSTAPVQGNQPLIRELQAVLCSLPRAGSTPFAKVIRKGAVHTQRREGASGFPLQVLEHLPPK